VSRDGELSRRARDASARYLGWLLIALSVVVNPLTLAFYSIDGSLSRIASLLVVGGELLLVGSGLAVLLRRPRWSPRAALLATATIAALFVVEAFAIATGILLPDGFQEHHDTFYVFEQPDAELGFRLQPNLRGLPMTYEAAGLSIRYDTDERGFRNAGRDYSAADVFVLGDSFTFGAWVERERTFYGLLEQDLQRPVISLGVGGYGMGQYRILAERYLAEFRPSVALLCIFANDLQAIPSPAYMADWYDEEGWSFFAEPSYPKASVLRNFSRVLGRWLRPSPEPRRTSDGLALFHRAVASPEYLSHSQYEQVEAALTDIIGTARRSAVELQLFLFPSKESAYEAEYLEAYPPQERENRDWLDNEEVGYERICGLAERHGVPCTDLTPHFRARAADSPPLYFADDGHWTELGHRVAAQVMRPAVQTALERSGSPPPLASRD